VFCTQSPSVHASRGSQGFFLSFAILIALPPLAGFLATANAATYYVDVDSVGGPASDSNPGTISRPFKTIGRAQEAVRGTHGNTVYIRQGGYCLSETLHLTAADSGGPGAPNVYAAFPGEHPSIKGSVCIPAGQFVAHSGNIVKANLASFGVTAVPQLFMNDRRLVPARYPNYIEPDFNAVDPFAGSFLHVASDTKASTTRFKYVNSEVDPSRWTNLQNGRVNVFPTPNYGNCILGISSIDPAASTVTLATASDYSIVAYDRYYFEHIFEELDAPNEWYWDKARQVLYLYPEHALTSNDLITIPRVNYTIFLQGAKYVEFRGLRVGEAHEQAFILHYCDSVAIKDCEILNSGSEGVGVWLSKNIRVEDCDIHATGSWGIYVAVDDTWFKSLINGNCIFTGNTIHETGEILKARGMGMRLLSVGTTASWNHIYNVARAGIEIKGNDNVVEYNYIHGVNRETQDSGSIYGYGGSWVKRGNIIRHNYLQGSGGYGREGSTWQSPCMTMGIYLDDFASGTHVYGNTITDSYRDAINVHSGRDNIIEKNTIIETENLWNVAFKAWDRTNPTLDPMWAQLQDIKRSANGWDGAKYFSKYPELSTITEAHPPQDKIMCGNVFRDNIIVWSQPVDIDLYRESWLDYPTTIINNNYVWSGGNPIIVRVRGVRQSWEYWKSLGFDCDSKNVAVNNSVPPSDYMLLVNTEKTARTFHLGSQSYRDVEDHLISGSITLQPFESKVLFTSKGGYALAVTAINGTVAKSPNKATYDPGTVVTLQATPDAGYKFVGWSGAVTGATNPATLTMNASKSVVANFEPLVPAYTLAIGYANGTVTKSPNKSTYSPGEAVALQATPNFGYVFSHWSGDISGTDPATTVTMNSSKVISANFTPIASPPMGYSLTVNAVNGSVAASPSKATYNPGETVTLQATANSGYTFAGWSGDASGSANPLILTMNGDTTVTADFAAGGAETAYTLTVITSGGGKAFWSPTRATYAPGHTVILTSLANYGYVFTGWSGDVIAKSGSTSIVMNGNKTVTASFAPVGGSSTHTLTVRATNGVVSTSPSKASYDVGETVTLQATPSPGYTFAGWSGDATGIANPITVAMNSNKVVAANFTVIASDGDSSGDGGYTLALSATNGQVSYTPQKATYQPGERVYLTAIADHGYLFSGWSGDLASKNSATSILMDGSRSIVANFTPQRFTLTLKAAGGSVVPAPNRLTYDYGEVVTLQATPNAGYSFVGWASDASGTETSTAITIVKNMTVTAKFTLGN